MDSLIARALADHQVTTSSIWLRRVLLLLNLTPPFLIWHTGGTQLCAWLYAIVVHHVLLIGLFHPPSKLLGPILTRLPTREKIVWLTIDDGPSADTAELAEMLGEKGISATFFFQGNKLRSRPEALSALRKHGHTVGNHTQNHDLAWFWLYPPKKVAREVADFQAAARQLDLPLLPAFRCPAGLKNPFLHTVLHRHQLTLTGWTLRAFDGVRCDPQKSLPRLLSSLEPGAIILVHEGKNDLSGAPASVAFISDLVTGIQAAGYTFAR
ncbi:MAG TPA: polysaccharide deacetylase family protein [Chthoniobacterales bacterium]|jgi:peptidoglycan/xylan/chitin deacetylase (PgdA/CDA1 family)